MLLPGSLFTLVSFLCCNLFGKKKKSSFSKEKTLTSKADSQVYVIEFWGGKRLKTAHSCRFCVYDPRGKLVLHSKTSVNLPWREHSICKSLLQSLSLWAWNACPSSSLLNNIKPRMHLTSLTENLIEFLILCFLGEDVSSFCASSVEQYYSWNIGKRRAAEVILSSSIS